MNTICQNCLTNYELTERHSKFQDDIKLTGPNNNFWKINSINQKVGKSWNELELSIRNNAYKTLATFTHHVKRWYISKYSSNCPIIDCYICNL